MQAVGNSRVMSVQPSMRLVNALPVASLFALATLIASPGRGAPIAPIAPPAPTVLPPAASPPRLAFGPIFAGNTRKLQVTLKPSPGLVVGTLTHPDFAISQMRAVPPAPGPAPNVATVAPFLLNVPAGWTVEADVTFTPSALAVLERNGVLKLSVPGPQKRFDVDVPLSGELAVPAKIGAPIVRLVEPVGEALVPITLTGTNQDVNGHFSLAGGPTNVSITDVPTTLKAHQTMTVKVPLHATDFWHDGWSRPGGYLHLRFTFPGHSATVATELRVYRKDLQFATKDVGKAHRTGCDEQDAEGYVLVRHAGSIALQFDWKATEYDSDSSVATHFTVRYRGQKLAEGIYPKTQQSAVYHVNQPGPDRFRSYYDPALYFDMVEDPSFSFSCKVVPKNTKL